MSDGRTAILESANRLRPTLGSEDWLRQNRAKLSLALPSSWTVANNESFLLRFGFALKIAGVEWTKQTDLSIALQWLDRIGIAESLAQPGSHMIDRPWLIRRSTKTTTI
jgi:hypothetical protein